MDTKMDILTIKQKLKEKNLTASFQRLKIMEFLVGNKEHPSVDKIFEVLSREIPSLSRTTVYNAVKTLKEAGLIQVLTINESEIHVDGNPKPHGHFRCLKCGKIYDIFNIKIPEMDFLNGNKVFDVKLYFTGICKECLKTEQ